VTALVLLTAAGARAADMYVDTNGNDTTGDGTLMTPYATISNAINKCSNGDTIWVSNGVYTLTAQVTNLNSRAKIRAWSTNPADTVLRGRYTNFPPENCRGVWMSGAGSSLQGFTVTNFYFTNENYAAGVYCVGGLISNCVITGNLMGWTAGGADGVAAYIRAYGGGVYLAGGVIENCSIIGNWIYPANYDSGGGGIYMTGSGQIRNCRIVGNRVNGSQRGAAVNAYYQNFVIQDSVIASNTGGSQGGSIAISGGIISNCQVFANSGCSDGGIYFTGSGGYAYANYARLERCVISNNAGYYVGGCNIGGSTITNTLISECVIVNNSGSWQVRGNLGVTTPNVRIRNCLVAYNRHENSWGESGYGGAVRVLATNVLIENCTIVSNTLTGGGSPQGAGLFVTNGVRVVNSIIYYNSGGTAGTSNISASADCTFSNSCTAPINGLTGTANTDANPQLVAKDTGNFRLNNNSPCLNTGMNYEWMTGAVDLDGRKRIHYGIVDMGAYERIHSGSIYGFR